MLALTANARGERWKALELMTLALGASRASRGRQRVAERAGLALIESVVLRITGRAADSVVAARRMSTLLDEAPPADLEEIADQIDGYRLQGALSLFRGGALSAARVAAERAGSSAFALSSGRPEALGAASVVGAVQAILGECRDADKTLARIDASDYPDTLRDGYVGSLSHLARGILALERNDPDAAERAVGLLRDHDNIEHGMLFTVLGALAWLWRGRPQIGLQLLDEREAVDRPRDRTSQEDRRALAAGRMLLHSALGEYGAARGALRAFERNDPVAGVLEASVLLLEQRPDLVVERLGRIRDLPGSRLQAAADLLVACAAQVAGDDGVTETAMRRFVALVAVHDVVSPFVLIPEEHRAALLVIAERVGADAATLARLRDLPAPFRATGTRVALTRRETEVLEKLSTNASQADIARALSVSTNTVKSQVRSLYRKLGASQRDEALRAAYLQGLLEGPAPRHDDPGRRPRTRGDETGVKSGCRPRLASGP
ncbi:LuxR family transcriptional regulator [Pseudolysinimonas kribbensis]|nr:LuxR family transcriptional regulator [Pseudolysinimonas kribbensis]